MAQFKALSTKNWILWKRNICGNITEIVVPLIFICFLITMRSLIEITNQPETSYIGSIYDFNIYGDKQTTQAESGVFSLKKCPTGHVVALSPPAAENSLVNSLKSNLENDEYTVEQFASTAAIYQRVRSLQYGISLNYLCFGISVQESTAGGAYKYQIHFNQSGDSRSEDPSTNLPLELDAALNLGIYVNSYSKGSVGLVTYINNLILQAETSDTNNVLKHNIVPIRQQAYLKDSIFEVGSNNVGILFILPLLIIYLRQTSSMLQEKQKKIRETMSIMGMKISVYYLTWFIRYFVTFVIVHVIGAFIVKSQLPKVGYIIPFVVFILFDIVLIIQSFFIQIFFSKAKIGVVLALLFFMIQYILSLTASNSDNPSIEVNTAISIIPHAAFITAFETMFYAESIKIDLTFSDVFNHYQISIAITSLVLNILFWLILTWYLDQVFPNEFGAKKHPLWCCFDKNKKVGSYEPSQESDSGVNIDIKKTKRVRADVQEVDPKYKQMEKNNQIINISHLRKEFNGGEFVAVDDLNVKMYNDNIFVMLGHNGAGKTTTLSMLTGMLDPTAGTIEVMGETQVQKIRDQIGVCPQHDTLYDQLTVQEHLQLFGTFRGLTGQELDEQVTKLIADVNLAQKTDEYSMNLSGGQKRRLSVAMAFAGRSKVIILDEPTSGMDTSARRYIWELLKSYKTDRIILLTTHFMDEADYLGDRIGIMAGGKLICCGSGYYLKNKFGVGYNITFVKQGSGKASQKIVDVVQKHIPNAIVLTDVSSQIAMQLPMDQVKKFPALFNEIDAKMKQFGISTYGISITTLEEVFLKVGQDTTDVEDIRRDSIKSIQPDGMVNDGYQIVGGKSPEKTVRTMVRDTEAKLLQKEQIIERIDGPCSVFGLHLLATLIKRLRVIRRDYKSFILQLVLPMFIIVLALLLMSVSFIVDFPTRQLSLATYSKMASPLTHAIGSTDTTLLDSLEGKLNDRYPTGIDLIKQTSPTLTKAEFDKDFLFPKKTSVKFFQGGVFYEGSSPIIVGTTKTAYEFSTIVNTKIPTTCLFLQTLAAETYINKIASKDISITLTQAPFPRTASQLQINNTIAGTFGALIFSIALAFKFASIISFIVKERQDRSKHQQIVSGMNIYAYWFGNFLYDYILYLVLAIFSIIMIFVMDIQAYLGDSLSVTIVVFVFYGLSYIPLTYMASFLFKDYGNAQAGFYFFTFVVGGLVSIIFMVLRFLGDTAGDVSMILSWILRLVPAYSFGEVLINLGSINLLGLVEKPKGQQYMPWDLKIALAPIIYLVAGFVVYTILVFVLESALNNQTFMRFFSRENKIEDTQQITDDDVLLQRQKALKADPEQYEILTKNLRKVFILDSDQKHKIAVDNLSFGIQKGEVFGLLGINGAGKTTTFKMLAGEVTSTSGDSFFTGMKISQNLKKVRQNLGYCPQFDALIGDLTVREQLQLFYDLKSLSGTYKDQIVSQKIRQMDLTDYEDKLSGTLSGGNKRKLSVAMAMIGNPNIIFLDEPSTGMDPKARRFMWKIISRIASEKKQSTIILTTHSMEQAEALSTRLGIMVKGNFKCIGTPQHIKSIFGQGYQVQIKAVPNTKDQIKTYMRINQLQNKITITPDELQGLLLHLKVSQTLKKQIRPSGSGSYIYNQLLAVKTIETFQVVEFVMLYQKTKNIQVWMGNKFGDCEVIQSFQTFTRFKVKAKMSVGKMFEALELEKDKIGVESYSIKQATVEQIFNRIAKDENEQMA